MKTIETFLPIFTGFYNTVFEPNNENDVIHDINLNRKDKKLKEITYDDCEWDYETYRNEVVENCCNEIETQLQEGLGTGLNVKFQKLISPKYYNYSNDSINVEITLDNEAIKNLQTFLLENFEDFEAYIDMNYSSYDGFISAHSNDATTWVFEYFSQMETNGHYLGAILQFVLEGYYNTDDLFEAIGNPSVHCTNYTELCEA